MRVDTTQSQTGSYPEGEALDRFVSWRNNTSSFWQLMFLVATIVGIIALMALLYNIINSAFGLVAVQNQVDPNALVLAAEEKNMLSAPNLVTSEDDNELVRGIEGKPYAIGFFGYAYYQKHQDKLKILTVEGVEPTTENAESAKYPLARPLFIYSAEGILQKKPQVAAFINYYLTTVNQKIVDVGYFPASEETLDKARATWLKVNKLAADATLPTVEPAKIKGDILVAGSSTVFPLTERLAKDFQTEGFGGKVNLESIGTTAGFRRFCIEGKTDVVDASRAIQSAERTACRAKKLEPVEFRIGTDAIAVVVSKENKFLTNVTLDQLQKIFTTAQKWSDVDPTWPAEPIQRFTPGADSGTLDFFGENVFHTTLADLPNDQLIEILQTATDGKGKQIISKGKLRQLENEQLFYEDKFLALDPQRHTAECASDKPPARCTLPPRSQEEVYALVVELIVKPEVKGSWSLGDTLFNRSAIELEALQKYPDADLEFRSWLRQDFITKPQSSTPELAGVRNAILGSLWLIGITISVAFPIGVGAAIYLEEYANAIANPFLRRVNILIQTNINNLAGVPSIIYGMLGLAIFVRVLEPLTSGALLGVAADPTTANGRTILSAGLTMALLILPVLIINAQEAVRAVPLSLRQAGMALGATKWQTIWSHVLPNAIPGILTGTILAISRAIGETAPLVVVGAATFITFDPTGPFSKFTALPIQIYQWTARPQPEFRNIAAAASLVLLVLLLTLNATAILLRNRFSRRLS